MDLPQQRERVTVDGLGNVGQGKYKADTSSEAKQEEPQQTQDTQKGISPVEQNNAVHSSTEAVTAPENINNKSVDKSAESGIIKEIEETREFEPLSPEKVVPVLRNDSEKWIDNLSSEEIRAIKKYTKNSGDPDDDKFFARLNAMLRGDVSEDETLKYYSEVISGAVSKFRLNYDIVCYRTIDFDAYSEYSVGDIFADPQFISTSVVKSKVLKKPFNVKINIPKGSNGAYIENLSSYPGQREFIIDKASMFKVISKSENFIELEMIL